MQLAGYEKTDSHGLDIHYRIFGEGEPVLVVGGSPGDNSNRYLSLCELLSADFSCILVDQRGTGKSYPETYDASTLSIDLTLDDFFEAIRKELGLETWRVSGFPTAVTCHRCTRTSFPPRSIHSFCSFQWG